MRMESRFNMPKVRSKVPKGKSAILDTKIVIYGVTIFNSIRNQAVTVTAGSLII